MKEERIFEPPLDEVVKPSLREHAVGAAVFLVVVFLCFVAYVVWNLHAQTNTNARINAEVEQLINEGNSRVLSASNHQILCVIVRHDRIHLSAADAHFCARLNP